MPTDPSAQHYHNTVLEFAGLSNPVDLREELGDETAATLRSRVGPSFAVITPFNPRGRLVSDDDNAARLRDFHRALELEGITAVSCVGRSPGGDHAESGAAICEPMSRARRRAADWQQSALFWFDGEQFWLFPAMASGPPERLPPKDNEAGSSR